MRIFYVALQLFTLLYMLGCASVPDKAICVREAAIPGTHPARLYCDTTLDPDGHEAFYVDDVSQVYTDSSGKTYNMDQLIAQSYILPNDTWTALSTYIQEECHQNNGVGCNGVGEWFGGATASALGQRIQSNLNK